ncbi:MAG: NAD-dependent epimerase/dehydratase family protein [Gemmatales bacterium]|nr:NAD-dependent epimerase/dehydratase family protein [Gemmatales bacterium]
MNKKLLIVGCGYLGKCLLRLALSEGWQVTATFRQRHHREILEQWGGSPIACDVTRVQDVARLPPADVVLYAVNLSAQAEDSRASAWWLGLQHLMQHWQKHPQIWRRFILVSSTSVYGQRDESWVQESAPTEPDSPSGQLTLRGEHLVLQAASWSGQPVIARLSGIYGPGRIVYARHFRQGLALLADPHGWLNLIHVADAARAILALADTREPDSVYNITDDEPVRRRDYWQALSVWLNLPIPPVPNLPIDSSANRRICNARIKCDLGIRWLYPSFRTGVPASLHQEETATASGLCAVSS